MSNSSEQAVYFDNFAIAATGGLRVVDRQDYYAFGLIHQQPLSSRLANRALYQGKELSNAFSIGLYDFQARFYDPSLGHFTSTDPAGQFHSPYNYAANNPISYTDPDGRLAFLALAAPIFLKGITVTDCRLLKGHWM